MSPRAMVRLVAVVICLLAGWGPTYLWYEAKEDRRAKLEAEAALNQEKRNVEIVTQYQDLLSGVSDWYRRHPVRVRIQGGQNCPGGAAPNAADVVLVVGGVARGDRGTVDP